MGVFENIFLPGFPYSIVKFAILNHWEGQGEFETQVKIISPTREELISSIESKFVLSPQGQTDNITFFANVTFDQPGTYFLQVYLEGDMVHELPLQVRALEAGVSGAVN